MVTGSTADMELTVLVPVSLRRQHSGHGAAGLTGGRLHQAVIPPLRTKASVRLTKRHGMHRIKKEESTTIGIGTEEWKTITRRAEVFKATVTAKTPIRDLALVHRGRHHIIGASAEAAATTMMECRKKSRLATPRLRWHRRRLALRSLYRRCTGRDHTRWFVRGRKRQCVTMFYPLILVVHGGKAASIFPQFSEGR